MPEAQECPGTEITEPYLLVDDGQVEVIRVAYDIDAEAHELLARAHPDAERLIKMRRLGRFVSPNPFP